MSINGYGDGESASEGGKTRLDPRLATVRLDPTLFQKRYSGRRLVSIGVLVILVIWGSIYALFRDWRSKYYARVSTGRAFAEAKLAPIVEPLADTIPPGIDPKSWEDAIAATSAMLGTLAGSGQMTEIQLEKLASDVSRRIQRSRVETIQADLIELWDDMQQGGPASVVSIERPRELIPTPRLVERFAGLRPADVEESRWLDRITRLRNRLAELTRPRSALTPERRQSLRRTVDREATAATKTDANKRLTAIEQSVEEYEKATSDSLIQK